MPKDAPAARAEWPFADAGETADTRGDAELIAAVRGGDSSAFAALWSRHHQSVLRYALQFPPRSNAEDLVSEAFARLLRVLQAGGGPDMNVRPYLLTAVKRLRIDVATRYERRVGLTGNDSDLEIEAADPAELKAMEGLEASLVWKAYSDLPERWQLVLWHTLIEEQPAAEVAGILGSSPNAVAALSMRAREGLRQAFLQAHIGRTASAACQPVLGRLGAWQRRALSNRESASVSKHLDECPECRSAAAEVRRLNQSLRSIVLPVVLGGVGSAAYFLSDGGAVSGPSAAGSGGIGKRGAHRRRSRQLLRTRQVAELKPVLLAGVALVGVVTTAVTMATMPSRTLPRAIASLRGDSATAIPSGTTGTNGTPDLNTPGHAAAGQAAMGTASDFGATTTTPGSTQPPGGRTPALLGPPGSIVAAPFPTPSQGRVTTTGQGAATTTPDGGTSPSPATGIAPSRSEAGEVRTRDPAASSQSSSTSGAALHRSEELVQVVAGDRDTSGLLRLIVPGNWTLLSVRAVGDDMCTRRSDHEFDCTVMPIPPPGKHDYLVVAESTDPADGDELIAEYHWGEHRQYKRYRLS